MMLLGERIEADEAAPGPRPRQPGRRWTELDAAVSQIVDTLAAKSPIALRLGLAGVRRRRTTWPSTTALPLLRERLAGVLATDDAREGLMAFLEKRPARWTGK